MKRFERLIDPFVPADGPPPTTLWSYGRWALKGAGPTIWLFVALSLILGIMEAMTAWMIGWVIDLVATASPERFFADNALNLALIAGFFVILRPALLSINGAVMSRGLVPSLYPMGLWRIHGHVLGQSMKYFEDDFAGRISQKEIQSTYALLDIINEFVHAILFGVATVVGAFVLLSDTDGRLAMVLAAWFAVYIVMVSYFLPRIRRLARRRADAKSVISGQLVDSLGHMATVKLYAHAGLEYDATRSALESYRKIAFAFGRMTWLFRTALSFLSGALPAALIGLALWLWQSGEATPGLIAVAGLISTRLAQMSGWISFTAMGIFSNVGVLEDGIRTLTPAHQITDAPDAATLTAVRGHVAFDKVDFQYGRKTGGITGFSLDVAPGERIALVGHSGAGKSTVVALLSRLYDVEAGTVMLDGHDVRTVTQNSLRQRIAVVTQDAAMFNRSAMDNIRYGRPGATEDEVFAAARKAEAHDFLLDLRDYKGRSGYQAHLGERGVKLSGGQRQRIALARAILKDAPVLILDEATAALDSESEAAIQSALIELMQGKTVIAIAHRLSTIQSMDRIVVMQDGRIAEQGSHDLLLARGGLYARFWSRQSGGLIGVDAAE